MGGACFQIRNKKITARGDYPNMIYINLPKDSERKEYMDLWTQGMAEHKKKLITKVFFFEIIDRFYCLRFEIVVENYD